MINETGRDKEKAEQVFKSYHLHKNKKDTLANKNCDYNKDIGKNFM